MSIVTDEKQINEILTRGVHELFTKDELKEKLMSGRQLHIKLGTDVTGPNLHLGHATIHRKLRDFQELGHKVTLIIGDFTTLVGDHSDKVDMRHETNKEEITENEKKYKEQFFKTVIQDQTEIRHNSEWLKDLNFADVINLAKHFTIAQVLDRETFMLRYQQKKPIGLDEFLYPLMQGFDSVALNCDVELGGTDQTFNLLAGRKLMQVTGQTPQSALVIKLLTGSDGRPMGKSLQNFIPVLDNPFDMYGKVMSIVDEIIFEYFELVTRVPMEEINQMKEAVAEGENPMKFKKRLAHEIVSFYHSEQSAEQAEKIFEETVQNREVSEELMHKTAIKGKMPIVEFLRKNLPQDISGAQIRRTIEQGGVEVAGVRETDFNKIIEFKPGDIVKFGKRNFIKVE